MYETLFVKSVMNYDMYDFTLSMEIITTFAAKWGSLTKRTPFFIKRIMLSNS